MAGRDPILEAVDLLAPAFSAAGLDELEVEVGDLRVRLVRPRAVAAAPPAAPEPHLASPPAPPAPIIDGLTPFGEPAPGMRFVGAPLTGVWYAAPSPGARPRAGGVR